MSVYYPDLQGIGGARRRGRREGNLDHRQISDEYNANMIHILNNNGWPDGNGRHRA